MPYTTINSGDYITSSWANENVRDQVVTPFSSTSARTSAVTTPVAGMVSTLTTNTATEGIYEYTSAGTWRLPWNMPWGIVASDNLTTSETITGTSFADVNGFVTGSFTPINRRYYKVTLSLVAKQFGSANVATFSLQVLSSTPGTVVGKSVDQTIQTSDFQAINSTFFINNSATTATTFKVQAKTTSSTSVTIDGTAWNCALIVEDMGPAGAPA